MGSVARKKMVARKDRSNYNPVKWYSETYIPQTVLDAVMARDNGRCQICGKDKDLQIRHRVPPSRGGELVEWNMIVMCRRCGYAKGNLTMEEFIQTAYLKFDILGIDVLGDDPVLVKVLLTDGTTLEGWTREDPETSGGDYYIYLGRRGLKVLLPREKVKAIVVIPKSAQGDVDIAGYLQKISS